MNQARYHVTKYLSHYDFREFNLMLLVLVAIGSVARREEILLHIDAGIPQIYPIDCAIRFKAAQ